MVPKVFRDLSALETDNFKSLVCDNKKQNKVTITCCDLSPRFFSNDAALLCKFESDEIWLNDFE